MSTRPIPEQGQLVDVRQRRYMVAAVQQSLLPPAPVSLTETTPQHLVTLSSVEDDALGEELQVIWEVEPGTQVLEQTALPTPSGFDLPQRFDAFLNAVRWGTAASADVRALQAPFRSGITIEDYQLDPVVRAIQMPRANLLIADDVGLGKTIEAGLVIQELMLRHRARTVLIVCPASLQIQWRDQLRDKFGLEFRIVDTTLMRDIRRQRGLHANPWTHFPRLVTSIDFLKRERPLRLFSEILPAEDEPSYPRRFDVLIVDEAHNIAPSGRGKYATDSQRTGAIRRLAPHFEHRLFLSATPHNGYPESFTALLELLDNQRFARGVVPDRTQLQAIMVRRLKSELPPRWDGTPRFPERQLQALEVAYTDAEHRIHRTLQHYSTLRQTRATDQTEHVATEFVLKLLKKRLFSSPEAFAKTLAQHVQSLETARRRTTALTKPSLGILRQQIEQVEEEFGDDTAADVANTDALESATRLFRPVTSEEQALLDAMQHWAEAARGRPDSKLAALITWLHAQLKPHGQWNDERVIIFTEYRDTQRWLQTLLVAAGLGDKERLLILHGGVTTEERERIKAAFQAAPEISAVRILLATDAASEGIDLQNYCSQLIHYEIPWNPNRLEQRNGRIDRHGQRAPTVDMYHFVSQGWQQRHSFDSSAPGDLAADLEFLMRAALKVNAIREDLGKVGPVIAEQVEEAMLGRRRRLDTMLAEHDAAPVQRMLKFEHKLRDQIAQLHEQLQESRRDLQVAPANVEAVVRIALELAGQPPLHQEELPSGQPVFYLPALSGSWAAAANGLRHPHTGQIRPLTFDHTVAEGRDDVVLAHLNHRLVQMALRLLRAEVWSPTNQRRLHRVTARVVPNAVLDTPAVIAHARLLVLGADQHRLHEEVIAAGGILREGRFARMNQGELKRALDAQTATPVSTTMQQRLADLWPKHRNPLLDSLHARARERSASLQKLLADREAKEIADLTTVLTELRATILAELHEPDVQQLTLFTDPEREQFEINKASLQARVERIPLEIEQETIAIRRRYAEPRDRLFPVAVAYLIPEKVARQ
ncbi:MAG: DEAD/DEAH box helicase [Chloroflexi bacterium]|nr:DEAD/DEAH box helicase [Chloroflexota bacterium]